MAVQVSSPHLSHVALEYSQIDEPITEDALDEGNLPGVVSLLGCQENNEVLMAMENL